MNERLAIVIPTYERSEILKENFSLMYKELFEHLIPIFISDDSKDTKTEKWVNEFQLTYPHINYFNNSPSLGHDKNLMRSIKLPDTDYVWLLGDSIIIKKGAISKILDVINENKNDIISINVKGRDIDFFSKSYYDHNEVLSKFGWHLTLTGATLYSKKVIKFANKIDFTNYRNFPQFSLVYQYLAIDCSFHWINDKLVYSNENKTSYWFEDIFEVFINDWSNAVQNLPNNYTDNSKEKTIINHSIKSKMFNLTTLMQLRSFRYYNLDVYKKYADKLPTHSNLKNFVLYIIAIFPPQIIILLKKIRK